MLSLSLEHQKQDKNASYSDVRNFEGEVLEGLNAEVHGENNLAIQAEGIFYLAEESSV